MKDKQINNVTLKRELEQLHSGKMKEFDHDNAYQRLLLERDEIEGQRKEYELKYGNLMDAYSVRIIYYLLLFANCTKPTQEAC